MRWVALIIGIFLLGSGTACQPEGADCAADDDCAVDQICAGAGGLLFTGGVCVTRGQSQPSDARDGGDLGDTRQPPGDERDVDPNCPPKTCEEIGESCGSFDDGCGRPLQCGQASCVAALAAGEAHTCAALGDGNVHCWGDNGGGQLGSGDFDSQETPTPVLMSNAQFRAQHVSAGFQHSCALDAYGSAWCWGSNEIRGSSECFGQLGTGDDCSMLPRTNRPSMPVNRSAVQPQLVALSTRENLNCARNDGGLLYCWGDGSHGQVGDMAGQAVNPAPAQVAGLGAEAWAVGLSRCYACAAADNGLYCWGDYQDGCAGEGHLEPATRLFEDIQFDPAICANHNGCIAGGREHTCFIDDTGAVFCFNDNSAGQLGTDPSTDRSAEPIRVQGLGDEDSGAQARQIAAGDEFSCALITAGDVYCWGKNAKGQLGNNSQDDAASPVKVALSGPARLIALGARHGCAALEDGGLQCWGDNAMGQLGNGVAGANRVAISPTDVLGF